MDELIAAIDDSAAARPVLVAAREIAGLFADDLIALHVVENGTSAEEALTNELGIPLRTRRGDPTREIIAAAQPSNVRGVVIGSRGLPSASHVTGHIAMEVMQAVDKPVVVVPPTATFASGPTHRLLLPVDGTGESAAALQTLLHRLVPGTPMSVVALHVFEAGTIPAFSDQAGYETEAWSDEFRQRWLAFEGRDLAFETRVGRVPEVVRTVAREIQADVIALVWKRDFSPGHAPVVWEVLAYTDVPVVLLPVAMSDG